MTGETAVVVEVKDLTKRNSELAAVDHIRFKSIEARYSAFWTPIELARLVDIGRLSRCLPGTDSKVPWMRI
jgi:hypothetical protein